MQQFIDQQKQFVEFSSSVNSFQMKAKHVFVITTYKEQWLLTSHKKRGLEFPGGKVEDFETLAEAAKREVYEETGGIVGELTEIGEYMVHDQHHPFVKRVYYADIQTLHEKECYFETNGPVKVAENILDMVQEPEYSFIMKDEILPIAIEIIKQKKLLKSSL
ncbi:nucleoside triphosphatase YtkD [Bacillus spongiae]|uniref:Nucleoside triphosphatase YtkD n=1 Tax=Bacillus spongiae TaxID=2683610 RepID=A0ABU8HHN6_9BACI